MSGARNCNALWILLECPTVAGATRSSSKALCTVRSRRKRIILLYEPPKIPTSPAEPAMTDLAALPYRDPVCNAKRRMRRPSIDREWSDARAGGESFACIESAAVFLVPAVMRADQNREPLNPQR